MLVDLIAEGNLSYDGWNLTCSCNADSVEELNQQARIMEDDLKYWRQNLKEAREAYYELNYYTNAQLLVLREKLAEEWTSNSPTLLMLLQSISPEIKSHQIRQAILISQMRASQAGEVPIDACKSVPKPILSKYVQCLCVCVCVCSCIFILKLLLKCRFNICIKTRSVKFLTLQQVGAILTTLSSRYGGNLPLFYYMSTFGCNHVFYTTRNNSDKVLSKLPCYRKTKFNFYGCM